MASRSGLPGGSVHRCMLVLTFTLLLCEVAVSRLCNSLINMVDGFHTLFILMHMALPLPPLRGTSVARDAERQNPALHDSNVSPPSSPLHSPAFPALSSTPTPSPIKSLQSVSVDAYVSPVPSHSPACTSTPTPPLPTATPPLPTPTDPQRPPKPHSPTTIHYLSPDSHNHSSLPHPAPSPPSPTPPLPPPSPRCGLSYSEARLHPVGSLISALLLAALCVSVSMEILSHTLQPHPLQRPLLATVMGAMSLLHNLLVLGLGLGWGRPLGGGAGAGWEEGTGRLWTNGEVKAKDQTKGSPAERYVDDTRNTPTNQDGSFQDGTLVLCNPGASSVLDPDCPDSPAPTQKPRLSPWADFPIAAPPAFPSQPCYRAHTLSVDSHTVHSDTYRDCERPTSLPQPGACTSHSKDPSSEPGACVGHSATQPAPGLAPALQSDQPDGRPQTTGWRTGCLPTLVTLTQALLGSVLVLANGLALLLLSPGCLRSPEACGLLVYLDPGFSTVVVLVLLATALPQMCRYGLLLLQASPPQLCVSDLGCRISSVPGVQAVHDLHVWRLTESCLVASVHVHCHAGFQTHRCGDLLSGVTKVLQSVGVTCWTVQPEFLLSASPAANGNHDNNNTTTTTIPTLMRENFLPLPLHLPCSLACGKGCTGKMCCTPLEEEIGEPPAPSAGKTEEEPQMLVIENTFL